MIGVDETDERLCCHDSDILGPGAICRVNRAALANRESEVYALYLFASYFGLI